MPSLCDQVMGCHLSCLSHRGQWHFCAKRDGNSTIPWLWLVQRTPVVCSVPWERFGFSGLSLGNDYRILCAPHFGGAQTACWQSCLLYLLHLPSLADGPLKHFCCLPILSSTETLSWLSHFSGVFFTSIYLLPNFSPQFQCPVTGLSE